MFVLHRMSISTTQRMSLDDKSIKTITKSRIKYPININYPSDYSYCAKTQIITNMLYRLLFSNNRPLYYSNCFAKRPSIGSKRTISPDERRSPILDGVRSPIVSIPKTCRKAFRNSLTKSLNS